MSAGLMSQVCIALPSVAEFAPARVLVEHAPLP
ncbi:hypothetical protein H4W79_001149 [Nocardiopsis terrae]|uniref:Uncharacterized protein n=1 Tax=Nocardiopsis terrae TaxID=372655 RepID=A0ABR9HD18_9ACTN|nr:hypothetical protein [Nocardiopsis terrae]